MPPPGILDLYCAGCTWSDCEDNDGDLDLQAKLLDTSVCGNHDNTQSALGTCADYSSLCLASEEVENPRNAHTGSDPQSMTCSDGSASPCSSVISLCSDRSPEVSEFGQPDPECYMPSVTDPESHMTDSVDTDCEVMMSSRRSQFLLAVECSTQLTADWQPMDRDLPLPCYGEALDHDHPLPCFGCECDVRVHCILEIIYSVDSIL